MLLIQPEVRKLLRASRGFLLYVCNAALETPGRRPSYNNAREKYCDGNPPEFRTGLVRLATPLLKERKDIMNTPAKPPSGDQLTLKLWKLILSLIGVNQEAADTVKEAMEEIEVLRAKLKERAPEDNPSH